MSSNKRRHKKYDGKNFLILPFIFCLIIYGILYFALSPVVLPLAQSAGLFFSDGEKDFSTSYNNIFVPITETADTTSSQQTVNIEDVVYPKYGEQFGELEIEDCSVEAKLFFGDNNVSLRNGVAVYNGSFIPGYGKTILVAGHNNTYFNGLKYAKPGQKINVYTSYGNYVYEITETAIKNAKDQKAYDLEADEENLILYTCYPFDELGLTAKRFFVYAKFVSGPTIVK